MTYHTRSSRPLPRSSDEARAAKQHLLDGLLAAGAALSSADAALTVELNCWHDYRACGCWTTPEGAGDMDHDDMSRQLTAWRKELEEYYAAVAEADPLRPSAT
jgi:hypothetical protein